MWIKELQLKNVKSFPDSGKLTFSKGINILAGANNSGKSTILRSIQQIQPPDPHSQGFYNFRNRCLRKGTDRLEIDIVLAQPEGKLLPSIPLPSNENWNLKCKFEGAPPISQCSVELVNGLLVAQAQVCNPAEPNNFIYPYFSGRKPVGYQLLVNTKNTNTISEANEHLPSKVDRVSNPDFRHHRAFRDACSNALGLKVSCAHEGDGKQAGLVLEDGNLIAIDTMGDGTLSVVSMLVHLALASGKLFLIEEIENDLHPKALKSLLDFIITKSLDNQFIISTHSNIVVRHLGSAPNSKIFFCEMHQEEITRLPISTCKPVSEDPVARIQLLENLGYDLFDFGLWNGYLILEESTAERLIREFFIPQFCPRLTNRLRTIAAAGISTVTPKFLSFFNLFVFIHTSEQYKNKAWVAVDAGTEGEKVIGDLRNKFKDWRAEHFRCFKEDKFEKYYPARFQPKVAEIFKMADKFRKQTAKGKLVEEVLAWAIDNVEEAKKAFSESAKDIINLLTEIEITLKN